MTSRHARKLRHELRRSREFLEEEVARRTAELADTNRALRAEIAERKRAELALRDRESRLRSIVESAVDGIILIDERGTIEAFNPAAERIFGYYDPGGRRARNVKMLMPNPYRDEHDSYLDAYMTTGVRKVIGIGRDALGLRQERRDVSARAGRERNFDRARAASSRGLCAT